MRKLRTKKLRSSNSEPVDISDDIAVSCRHKIKQIEQKQKLRAALVVVVAVGGVAYSSTTRAILQDNPAPECHHSGFYWS